MNLAIPSPSPDFHTHQTVDAVFTWLTLAEVLVAAGYATRLARQQRTAIPVLVLLGGFAAALVEPLISTMGMVQYPPAEDQWVGLEAYGQAVPVFSVLAYGMEVGVGALIVWTLLSRGLRGRAVLGAWVAIMAFDLVLESVGIWLKVFRYYGHQPFNFWGMPLWWLPIDASICLLPGIAAFVLSTRPARWYAHLGLVVLFPVSATIMYCGPGWPVFLLLHTDLPAALVWAAGIPTVAISVGMVLVLVRVADRLDALRRVFAAPPEDSGDNTGDVSGAPIAERVADLSVGR